MMFYRYSERLTCHFWQTTSGCGRGDNDTQVEHVSSGQVITKAEISLGQKVKDLKKDKVTFKIKQEM